MGKTSWKSRGLIVAGLVLGLALPAQAALVDRGLFDADGSGPGSATVRLVFDDDLMITWLGDANFGAGSTFDNGSSSTDGLMTWQNAVNWADSLMVGGFTDWRLPTTTQPDATCSRQTGHVPPQGNGVGCTGSEMGHLFYDELGGTANSSILTSVDPDLALFSNIQTFIYWSGTEFVLDTNDAWLFLFDSGNQGTEEKNSPLFGWAVRSGDVSATTPPPAVPEPSTILLLGSGLVGLIGWQRARRG